MRIWLKMCLKLMAICSMRLIKVANWMMNPAPVMAVKKTVLFTFFKAPKRHAHNTADKQELQQQQKENNHLISALKVMFMCCFYILWQFFQKGWFWLDLDVPRLQCILPLAVCSVYLTTSRCGEWLHKKTVKIMQLQILHTQWDTMFITGADDSNRSGWFLLPKTNCF